MRFRIPGVRGDSATGNRWWRRARSIAAAVLMSLALLPLGEASQKDWTVLIFMNGKNDLEKFALDDFEELAAIDAGRNTNLVVQMGRPHRRPGKQADLKTVFGGWSGARRFHIEKGKTPSPGSEVEIVGAGRDVDMGSEKTLEDFLSWGRKHYPAQRYAVIVWNHGQGYRLVMTDAERDLSPRSASSPAVEPSSARGATTAVGYSHRAISQDADTGSIIYNADLRKALQRASFGKGLRLVGFDACLMGMVETAYELRDLAPVMVASEELEPGAGWNYSKVVQLLAANSKADEVDLAKGIVESYRSDYGDRDATTLSAIRLSGAKPLATALSALSDVLLVERDTLFPLVREARSSRGAYNEARTPVSIDLIGFLTALERQILERAPSSPALKLARDAKKLAEAVVFANYSSASRGEPYGSYGIAIYFPESRTAFDRDSWGDGYLKSNRFKTIDFVANERWSDFLQVYLGLPK